MEIIKHNSSVRIIEGACNTVLVPYFTRGEDTWLNGKKKRIEVELFTRDQKDMIIPAGMLFHMNGAKFTEDHSRKYICELLDEFNGNYDTLPSGIKLRPYQVDIIKELIKHERGMAQIATGAGKTLIIAKFCEICSSLVQGATQLIIVPSSHLLYETSERLRSYGLDVNIYGESRALEVGKINVTMVTSILNDVNKGYTDLDIIDIVVVDEAHHATAATYYELISSIKNARHVLGVSGSLLSRPIETYDWNEIFSFSLQESRLVSIFHKVIYELNYDDLVKLGYLTDVHIYQIETNIKSEKSKNFVSVAPETIESDERLELLADAVAYAEKVMGYERFICFTRVREAGERFLRKLEARGIKTLIAYGGAQNAYLSSEGTIEYVGSNELFPKFASGEYGALIATSSHEEGTDIPACDAIINLAGGKSIRQILQRSGRAFRLSEGKNFALIIDTYDKGHRMTKEHSKERAQIFEVRLNRKVVVVKSYKDMERTKLGR